MIYGAFESYGAIQKYIEEHGLELISGGFERIPVGELKEVSPEQKAELEKLIDKFEDDDDVQNVYHTMK
jgi:transcriptional/translational regulatory protein YebC/TACO1